MNSNDLLCSPEFVPQILGGELPFGLETENISVKHLEANETGLPASRTISPPMALATVSVFVCGPVITKVWKSSLSF